jgi:hypothetical protein
MDVTQASLWEWLLNQGSLVAVLGGIIYILYKRYDKAESEKNELAKDVIKLTTLYETKTELDRQSNAEIKAILAEIRDTLRNR